MLITDCLRRRMECATYKKMEATRKGSGFRETEKASNQANAYFSMNLSEKLKFRVWIWSAYAPAGNADKSRVRVFVCS